MAPAPILVALDTTDIDRARAIAAATAPHVWGMKIGLEFFMRHGPAGIASAGIDPARLFLDLKFHDIPNTVAGAVRAATRLGPAMMNVHASGGPAMLVAARAARDEAAGNGRKPLLLAVTVLTSFDDADLASVGQDAPAARQVRRLAQLARDSGLDGVVCSPREIAMLRGAFGRDFTLVVPGIRPAGTDAADQKRTMTPAEALADGADFLVIGRPIAGADDPAAAARAIAQTCSLAAAGAVAS